MHINETSARLLRLRQILAPTGPIPIGRTTWWNGVKSGRFPKPIHIGPRITAWRESDIAALLESLGSALQREAQPGAKSFPLARVVKNELG